MTKARSNATAPNAKGTLVVGNGTDASTTLAVASTAGYVLTVDSAETTGVKWAAASAPAFSGVAATQELTVANNTLTTINFTAEYFDTDGFHSNSTNTSRFTVPSGKAGYYMISMLGEWQDNSSGRRLVNFYKNGSTKLATLNIAANGANPLGCNLNYVANLAVGDYIEVKLQQTSGSTITWYMFTDAHQFSMYYLGA
jgi:hypothetical protein